MTSRSAISGSDSTDESRKATRAMPGAPHASASAWIEWTKRDTKSQIILSRSHMDRIDVTRLMTEIRRRANEELRERAFDRGNTPEFADADLFDLVERVLRGAVDDADRKVLLLSEIVAGNKELMLEPSARLTSHRPVVGPLIVFVKRRVLQALAIESARLRMELDAAKSGTASRGSGAA